MPVGPQDSPPWDPPRPLGHSNQHPRSHCPRNLGAATCVLPWPLLWRFLDPSSIRSQLPPGLCHCLPLSGLQVAVSGMEGAWGHLAVPVSPPGRESAGAFRVTRKPRSNGGGSRRSVGKGEGHLGTEGGSGTPAIMPGAFSGPCREATGSSWRALACTRPLPPAAPVGSRAGLARPVRR